MHGCRKALPSVTLGRSVWADTQKAPLRGLFAELIPEIIRTESLHYR